MQQARLPALVPVHRPESPVQQARLLALVLVHRPSQMPSHQAHATGDAAMRDSVRRKASPRAGPGERQQACLVSLGCSNASTESR